MRRVLAGALACGAAAALLTLVSCYGPDPNLTESGKGKPEVTVDFPAQLQRRSVETAAVTVTNPGPGDMTGFSIEFSLVGKAGGQTLPTPLVASGSGEQSPSIEGVEPEPTAVSLEGVRFFFGPLPEGESTEVRFEIEAPDEPGVAANAVIVSDVDEIDRSRGVQLVTEVTR
jgi:hypothetical protein